MSRFQLRPSLLALLAGLAMAAIVVGCGGQDDPVQVPPPEPIVEPRTPQQLLAWFVTAYEDMDEQAYLKLLEDEFLFLLQPSTTLEFPDLGGALDFAEEERIHQRMFSGEAVVDPEGIGRSGVRSIQFRQFLALDTWYPSDDNVRFPGTVWAPFSVDLMVDCGSEQIAYSASGQVKIYVREYIRVVGGKEVPYFRLAGMVDLTRTEKGVERTPWGLVKGFYR